jgi:cation diffusion facilitator family transporter
MIAAPNTLKFRLILLSFGVSTVLMVVKFGAWWLTNSNAILTDALESIVNVVASGFAFYSVYLSSLPRDENHPYGHGKIEFFSAGLEGVLIGLAGAFIIVHSVLNLLLPPPLEALGAGMLLTLITAAVNWGLGWALRREGTRSDSPTLVADGHHLILDAQSTFVLVLGLGLIVWTGWTWLDSALSILFACVMIYNAFRITRRSVAGLMDEVDAGTLERVTSVFKQHRQSDWIDVHNLRIQKYGADLHIDCHVTLPYYWGLERVHAEIHEIEEVLEQEFSSHVEIFIHADPCLPACCSYCGVADCPVRQAPHTRHIDWTTRNLSLNQKHFQQEEIS